MLSFSPVFTLDVAGFRKSDAHSEFKPISTIFKLKHVILCNVSSS